MPFVRFAASAQWAGDWTTYDENPNRYWAGMDSIFKAAEQGGVLLVPSIFWHPPALAFHLGEPMQAWGRTASRTSTFSARYAAEMVDRYGRSPALLMWEFGNELNDWVDLPNALQFWPKQDPTMPLRARSKLDLLTHEDLYSAVAAFAATVGERGDKPIGMGSNVPRQNAWHLARGSWKPDTAEQFIAQFRAITPIGCDVLSMHLYPHFVGTPGSVFANTPLLLEAFVNAAAADQRITFLGEFGVFEKVNKVIERQRFEEMVEQISRAGIQYAALWDYDRRVADDWNITLENNRSYQIDVILAANK